MAQASSLKPQDSAYLGALDWLNSAVRLDDPNYRNYFNVLQSIRTASGADTAKFNTIFQEGLRMHVELKKRVIGTPQEREARIELASVWKDFEKDFSRKGGVEKFDAELERYAAMEDRMGPAQAATSGFMTGGSGTSAKATTQFDMVTLERVRDLQSAWHFVSSEDFRDSMGKPLELYFNANTPKADIEEYLATRHRVGLLTRMGDEHPPAQRETETAARGSGTIQFPSKAVVKKRPPEEWELKAPDLSGGVTATTAGRVFDETARNVRGIPRTIEDALQRKEKQVLDPITGKVIAAQDIADEVAWHFSALDNKGDLQMYFNKSDSFDDIQAYMRKLGRYGNLCHGTACMQIVSLEAEKQMARHIAEKEIRKATGGILGGTAEGRLTNKLLNQIPGFGKSKKKEEEQKFAFDGVVKEVSDMAEVQKLARESGASRVVLVVSGKREDQTYEDRNDWWCGPCANYAPTVRAVAAKLEGSNVLIVEGSAPDWNSGFGKFAADNAGSVPFTAVFDSKGNYVTGSKGVLSSTALANLANGE
jgi:hypothetical protein